MLRTTRVLLAVAVLTTSGVVAFGGLSALGPVNAINGFPLWVQDTAGNVVEINLDPALGISAPAIPGNAFSQTIGFGEEAFFWSGESTLTMVGGNAGLLVMAVEAAFLNGPPADGDQMIFGRMRIRMDAPVAGTYRIVHPYGVEIFRDVPAGRKAINFTSDIIGLTPNFAPALKTPIGPLLTAAAPPPPAGFMGTPLAEQTVVGSPFGTNYFRIEGPVGSNLDGAGNDFIQTDKFLVTGKYFTGGPPPPTPLEVNQAVIRKSKISATADIIARSTVGATITVTAAGAAAPLTLRGDGTGNFYGALPLPTKVVPTQVTVTASLGGHPDTTLTKTLIDEVKVTAAVYDAAKRTLTVTATSSYTPAPAMTVRGLGAMKAGRKTITKLAVPPTTVTVESAKGGVTTAAVTFRAR